MRRFAVIAALLLCGCGGQSSSPLPAIAAGEQDPALPPVADERETLSLLLTGRADAGTANIELAGVKAQDLYQIAGTIVFDAQRYQLLDVTSSGGLGNELDSYFIWAESAPGRLDFAYTRRYYGRGADGFVPLLGASFNCLEEFQPDDFTLSTAEGALLARDSAKGEFAVELNAGVPQ